MRSGVSVNVLLVSRQTKAQKIAAITTSTSSAPSIGQEVALGIRRPLKPVVVQPTVLARFARDCLKNSKLEPQEEKEEEGTMSTAIHHQLNGNRLNSEAGAASSYGDNQSAGGASDTPTNANLSEESMMVLSQSIDSIHAIATTGAGETLDVSCAQL